MKKYSVQLASLALLIVVSGASNNAWAMEQPPIYEILARKKVEEWKELRKEQGVFLVRIPFDFEKYYVELLEKYKEYEGHLAEVKHVPEASLWGGINYAMTLEEMKQKIKATFSGMKRNGLIVSKNEFEGIKDKYFNSPRTDLNRIWGVEYLKNKISESPTLSKKYDVPQYIIVVDDPHKISVKISFFSEFFPSVNALNNGEIYFENIKGTKVASWNSSAVNDIGIKSGIGYDDFSDPGNIIRQSGIGKYYIVDTEYKSFKIKMNSYLRGILEYASERFIYLNHEEYVQTYEFDL